VKIREHQKGAVTVLKPDGPLTEADAEALRSRLMEALREKLGRIVLDASAVPYVDSKQALKLCSVNETVRQVLELTGVSSQFEHFEDTNSAVRSFL